MNCLHGTVLYVCMYLIFLYEVCVFFIFCYAVVTYVCCFDAYSVTPCAAKEQKWVWETWESVPKQKPEDISCVK